MVSLNTRRVDQNLSINCSLFFLEVIIAVLVVGWVYGLLWQTALATSSENAAASVGNVTCSKNLDALVAYTKETAEVEGRFVSIERKADGVVLLHDEDFVQQMRCRDGELHIDVRDPR